MKLIRTLYEIATRSEDPYFPPLGHVGRRRIKTMLRQAGADESQRLDLARRRARSDPKLYQPFDYEMGEASIEVRQDGRTLRIPRPLPDVNYVLLTSGYVRWLERKYALPGFCEVEPGDYVVDCGAYIGGFGLSAAEKARRVDFFEPDPVNFSCLSANVEAAPHLFAHQMGLFDKSGTLRFNRSESSVEHSFLAPDDGTNAGSVEVRIERFDRFASEHGIARVDFLKLEAEGVEIEAFDGFGDLPIRKIAIDAGAERNGESPQPYFKDLLARKGYEIRTRGKMLFARRDA